MNMEETMSDSMWAIGGYYNECRERGKTEMRELNTIQKREKLNKVYAVDEPGNGGANHKYIIFADKGCQIPKEIEIAFQNGPRKDPESISGVFGTNEK